jgi:hypothetical protein
MATCFEPKPSKPEATKKTTHQEVREQQHMCYLLLGLHRGYMAKQTTLIITYKHPVLTTRFLLLKSQPLFFNSMSRKKNKLL